MGMTGFDKKSSSRFANRILLFTRYSAQENRNSCKTFFYGKVGGITVLFSGIRFSVNRRLYLSYPVGEVRV